MKLKNNFSDEIKGIFCFNYECWSCGGSWGDGFGEYHHILGRVSNSPLNLAPLCLKCHAKHIEMKSEENIRKFLKQTITFLCDPNNQYIFTYKDIKFYQDNIKYYGN